MAHNSPQEPPSSQAIPTRTASGKRPALPEPMPVQYHETIEKSWRGHAIPTVPRSRERRDD